MPLATASTLSPEVLELLHRLAMAEETANDALRVLHELRVHQVELDLQLEQAHQNEQDLAQELAVYRNLWQAAPDGYFSVSLDGHILMANPAGAALFGVDAAALPGRPIYDLVAAEFRPQMQTMLGQLRESGSTAMYEARSNGSSLPLRVVASLSPDSQSCVLLIVDSGQTDSLATSS